MAGDAGGLQGALLFLALLVLLWVPLIVFSSGNPTYQVTPESQASYYSSKECAIDCRDQGSGTGGLAVLCRQFQSVPGDWGGAGTGCLKLSR